MRRIAYGRAAEREQAERLRLHMVVCAMLADLEKYDAEVARFTSILSLAAKRHCGDRKQGHSLTLAQWL